jgi:maltooligosyltrehalose trehalohydrolase
MREFSFGPRLDQSGVTFRLWAPNAKRIELLTGDAFHDMGARNGGWFEHHVAGAAAGTKYQFRVDGKLVVPDPASHFQPSDVNGPSEVVAHDYTWRCADWKGRPWEETVLLELHVGTFTEAGTYRAVLERLDDIASAGITAIELMPLADFSGARNWGYDGVLLYAPDSSYGRPEDLKALIDAAHERGLMVFLDVVYNHFGPEGNYLPRLAPSFFTSHHHTPWGDAIDYRVNEVRAFAVENALHWLRHYRFDGLRLDAVHAIVEPGRPSILEDISNAVGELATETGRIIHLVLENDDNRASLLNPAAASPAGQYRAQWNDDYHHAWHVLLSGETSGYYEDYKAKPIKLIERSLTGGFIYQGQPSPHRKGAPRGEPSSHLPPMAFVNFLQNHDQIGNRAYGERLTSLAQPAAIDAALTVTLLAPAIPLLFMGEEWGSTKPFPFFCDFEGELADAVRRGRKAEFEAQFANVSGVDQPPDPLDEATFRSAVLDWHKRSQEPYASRYALVKALLACRKQHIVPLLERIKSAQADTNDGSVLHIHWDVDNENALHLVANLGDAEAGFPTAAVTQMIWGSDRPKRLPAWSVVWFRGPM